MATKNCHLQQRIIPYTFFLQNINIIIYFHSNLHINFFILIILNSLSNSKNQNSNFDSTNYDINTFPFSNSTDNNGEVTT